MANSGQFVIEGRVHAALASVSAHCSLGMPNREVSVAFRSTATRGEWMSQVLPEYEMCLAARDPAPSWWPTVDNLGTGCDFLGVDEDGRLLAVEAKPSNATQGISAPGLLVRPVATRLGQ